MFGPGTRLKPVLKAERTHDYPLDSLSWMNN